MEYFLDVHLFSPEEIALNATVLQWPQKINPIFDEHDDVRIFFFVVYFESCYILHFFWAIYFVSIYLYLNI